jgi:hypothetical protein
VLRKNNNKKIMQKLHFSIHINAAKEKVWDTMLSPETYSQWTKIFDPHSRYEGKWEQGSEIKFLGGEEGEAGMYSMIRELRPYEFVSIEHVGMINKGVIDTTSEFVKSWTPAFENYTFVEKDGGTEVLVDIDVNDDHKDEFNDMWPKSLQIVKELAEK